MRKLQAIITALALVALAVPAAVASAPETPAERFCGCWQDPYYGRAMLAILRSADAGAPEDGLWFDVSMRWGGSADSEAVWRMSARYDAAADALVYEGGVLTYVTYAGGGEVASEEVRWDDAEGGYALSDGKLLWADSREERAPEFAFEPVEKVAPGAEELRERYFEAVADWQPATAGSSLKLAGLCADLLGFADEYRMWDADIPALRENLRKAWTDLDEPAQRRFEGAFPEVAALMDAAFSDYSQVAGQFGDAGAGNMARLADDAPARASWEALAAHTCAMGDGESPR